MKRVEQQSVNVRDISRTSGSARSLLGTSLLRAYQSLPDDTNIPHSQFCKYYLQLTDRFLRYKSTFIDVGKPLLIIGYSRSQLLEYNAFCPFEIFKRFEFWGFQSFQNIRPVPEVLIVLVEHRAIIIKIKNIKIYLCF